MKSDEDNYDHAYSFSLFIFVCVKAQVPGSGVEERVQKLRALHAVAENLSLA